MRIALAECDSTTARFNFEPSKTVANLIVETGSGEGRYCGRSVLSYDVSTRHVADFAKCRKRRGDEKRKRAVGWSKLMEDSGIDYP